MSTGSCTAGRSFRIEPVRSSKETEGRPFPLVEQPVKAMTSPKTSNNNGRRAAAAAQCIIRCITALPRHDVLKYTLKTYLPGLFVPERITQAQIAAGNNESVLTACHKQAFKKIVLQSTD
ncbi:hypothetical protein [uncultured Martelella sp.]|uniref:hypothetical protein n=1 Tax=uncultured Martelella sp. TaxID=392331 RepID=UPI0029C95916|nr:hypothetical protein [uncultured Martelella sp.]